MIGLITPPFGAVLFALVRVSAVPFDRLVKNIFLFYIPLLITLLAIMVFPPIVTYVLNFF